MIRLATKKDFPVITELLRASNLVTSDLEGENISFLVYETEAKIVGCIGLEIFGKQGLLRSLCTDVNYRGKGIGDKLVEALLSKAKNESITTLYLLTETADTFFEKRGFTAIARESANSAILKSRQFIELCPDSAVCMKKEFAL